MTIWARMSLTVNLWRLCLSIAREKHIGFWITLGTLWRVLRQEF